jgi:hypothetical protein
MLHQSSTVIIGAGFCWLFLLLGWAGLLLSTTTLCLQKHKEHTCKTAQQQDASRHVIVRSQRHVDTSAAACCTAPDISCSSRLPLSSRAHHMNRLNLLHSTNSTSTSSAQEKLQEERVERRLHATTDTRHKRRSNHNHHHPHINIPHNQRPNCSTFSDLFGRHNIAVSVSFQTRPTSCACDTAKPWNLANITVPHTRI